MLWQSAQELELEMLSPEQFLWQEIAVLVNQWNFVLRVVREEWMKERGAFSSTLQARGDSSIFLVTVQTMSGTGC